MHSGIDLPASSLDHEKTRQRKTDAERKGDAIARKSTAINTQAIEQRYNKMTETTMNEELNVSADKESEAQLNRLAIRIDIPTEGEYKEMEAVKIEHIDDKTTAKTADVEKLCKNFVEWNLLKTLPKTIEMLPFEIEMKMIISRLRHEQTFKKASKGEFAKCIHKYLKSKKTEETTEFQMLQIAKIAKKVQTLERKGINCSKYMRPFTAEINGYSACTEILFNEKRCKDVLSSTIKECKEKILSSVDYNQVKSLWEKWSETIFVQNKPLEKHRLTLEHAFDAIKQNYQADKAITELKQLIEGAKKEEKEELERAEKEEETNIEFIIKKSQNNLHKKLKFVGAKLLFAFIEGRLLTEACNALTNALKLMCEAQTTAKDMVECGYKFEYANATQKWLQIFEENKEACQKDFNLIVECGSASAAGRSLIAYETKTNLRIYAVEEMIENHYPEATHIHHVSLDPKTGALQLLAFNPNHVELCDYRENFGITFRQKLERYEDENMGIKGVNLIHAINALHENEAVLCRNINYLFSFLPSDKRNMPVKQSLKLLCDEFPLTGVRILNALLLVFTTEGCYIDVERLSFIIDTAFDNAMKQNYRHYLFASILLSYPQNEWIDEIFILNCEDSLSHKIRRTGELKARLSKITDDRLKILCTQKLRDGKHLNEDQLFELLHLLKDAKLAYPELRTVDIEKWPEIIQGTHVFNLLKMQKCLLNEAETEIALFWCCKIAEVFGVQEAVGIFAVLASQSTLGTENDPLIADLKEHGKVKVSPSILGRLVQRLCNNEIASSEESVSPASVFWTIWSSIENASELPKVPNEEMEFCSLPDVAAELLTPPEASKARELDSILKIMKKGDEQSESFKKAAFLLSGKSIDLVKATATEKSDSENDTEEDETYEEEDDEPPPGYHGTHTWQETTTRYDPYRNCYITETKTYTGNRQPKQQQQSHQRSWEKEQRRQQKEWQKQQQLQQKEYERQQKLYEKHVRQQQKEAMRQQREYQKAIEKQQKQTQNQMMAQMKQQMRNMGMHGYSQIIVNGQPVQVNLDSEDEEEDEEDEENGDEGESEGITEDSEEEGDDETTAQDKKKKKADAKILKSVEECMKLVNGKSKPDQLQEPFKSCFPDDTDNDLAMLLMVDEVILKHRGFRLRDNQKLAVLCALKSDGSILQQIATGEGKSLIIAAISIISVLKGHTVNIVTSSSTLAKRDVESPAPKGCTDLYAAFGISAAHVCMEDSGIRQNLYASCDIIYGDLTSFQRDYLLDTFYGMNIVGGRKFDVILVDEVDSMLLDQGSNMLYLSHEIPDFELLQPLFVRIWQIINAAISTNGNVEFETDKVIQKVKDTLFNAIDLTHLKEIFDCTEFEAENLRMHLLREKISEADGTFIDENADVINARIESLSEISTILKDRLQFVVKQIFDQQKLFIPKHLHSFVRRHLKEFIENAKAAIFMKEGEGYQIDCAHMDSSISYEPRVIIVEQGTGVDLPTTQWSNGLHQFLQLKHGCRLSALSLKAVFISNVSFLKKYEHLYGFSGTLGAAAERAQLSEMYNLDCVAIPSSLPKLLYEECSIVSESINEWISNIFESLLLKLKSNRSILVICESIRQVNTLSTAVKMHARKALKNDDGNFLRYFENSILYRRDRETFDYGSGTKDLECGKIIFSTNLAGRGTDIKLCKELVQSGGLHVIVAFLPDNIRVEEQAFGRAARCGEPGTAQLIVLNDSEIPAHISRLKIHRNAEEVKRIQAVTTFYDNSIKVEEDCFEQFAAIFKGLSAQMDCYEGCQGDMKQLLSRDLLDRWADWLDSQPRDGKDGKAKVEKAAAFVQTLNLPNQKPLRPLNRVRCGVLNAIAKNFAEAESDFDYVICNFPDSATEAKYYKGFTIIKQTQITGRHDPAYLRVKQLFDSARRGFLARSEGCQRDRSIIESYRQRDNQTRFSIDIFNQQQSEISQLMQMFASSIDGLLGGRLDYNDFVQDVNSEEGALKVYEGFKDSGPIEGLRFADNFDERNIDTFCKANFVSNKKVFNLLKKVQSSGTSVENLLNFDIIEQPTLEEFWHELIHQNLIIDVQQHVFLNTTKIDRLNPALADLLDQCCIRKPESESISKSAAETENDTKIPERIFMNSMVSVDQKSWTELNQQILNSTVSPDGIKTLQEIGAIIFTQSANLNKNIEIEKADFSKFSYFTEMDLQEIGIPSSDVSIIIENLIKKEIFICQQNCLKLNSKVELDISELTQCYAPIVEEVIKLKFAYTIAYRTMRKKDHEENKPIKIQLPTRIEAAASIMDLIDSGVFEYVNVNFKALNGEGHVSSVLNNAQYRLTSYLQASPSSDKIINNYEKIGSCSSQIFQQFKGKSGIDKYETVDAKLVEIWKKMGASNLVSLQDTFLYTSHVATHIIEYMEKKWSSKMLRKIAAVAAFALAQLVVGGAIAMFTAGSGVFLSKFFISEGISDLIFAIIGACTGYAGSYQQHKLTSMMSSALLCGAAAFMAHGSHFNSLAHSLKGPCALTKGVKTMALSGFELIKEAKFWNVVWAAIKEVGKQVLTALANLAVFTALQQALQGLIKTAIAKAREYLMKYLTFDGAARLKATLYKVIKELGVAAGSQLASKCGAYIFSSKNKFDDFIGKACDFIFKEYRHLFLGVCSGVEQGAAHAHTTAGLVMAAVSKIPTLLMMGEIVHTIKTMYQKLSGIHDEIEVVIIAEFEAKQSIAQKFSKSEPKSSTPAKSLSEAEIEEACQKLLDQWQGQLAQEVDTIIDQRIATPLLSKMASKIEGYIESAVKTTYEKVMEWRDEADLAKYEKEYKEEKGASGENEKVAWDHFEKKLNALMERTRSPEVMKDIIANCSKIDMTCASAAGAIIPNIIHGPVKMIIKDENGSSFEHVSGQPIEDAKTICIDLKAEHYGDQTNQSGKNSCLFDALSAHVPEFHNAIHDDKQFREILGDVVTHDPYYRLHISSGWQSIAIQQDQIGGKVIQHGSENAPNPLENVQPGVEIKRSDGRIIGYAPHLLKDEAGNTIGAEYTMTGEQLFEMNEENKTIHDKKVGTRADPSFICPEGYDRGHIRAHAHCGVGDIDYLRPHEQTSNRGLDSQLNALSKQEMAKNYYGSANYRIEHTPGYDKVQIDFKNQQGEYYKTMTSDIPNVPNPDAPRDIHVYHRDVPPPQPDYTYIKPDRKNKK